MKRLFIIGNGFDCYGHFDEKGKGMPTSYKDFRDYIIQKYPTINNIREIPFKKLTADHQDYNYRENEMAGYIVNVLDSCKDDNWATLEEVLGNTLFGEVIFDLIDIDILKESDKDMFNGIRNNEELSEAICASFCLLRELFEEWVNKSLNNIEYCRYKGKPQIDKIINEQSIKNNNCESEFINFNYTLTLEKIYKIPETYIHHFHGKVGDNNEKIIFGHGNSEEIIETSLIGTENNLNKLKNTLYKNTSKVILENMEIYRKLQDVTDIFSYGFSFSNVDMPYIKKLLEYVNTKNVTWHFNTYDSNNNIKYLKMIKSMGYKVVTEENW